MHARSRCGVGEDIMFLSHLIETIIYGFSPGGNRWRSRGHFLKEESQRVLITARILKVKTYCSTILNSRVQLTDDYFNSIGNFLALIMGLLFDVHHHFHTRTVWKNDIEHDRVFTLVIQSLFLSYIRSVEEKSRCLKGTTTETFGNSAGIWNH